MSKWEKGSRFKVLKECALHGWQPHAGYHTGFSVKLKPGDILECMGFRQGWGSDPIPETFWRVANRDVEYHGNWALTFYPTELWKPWPPEGYVEAIKEKVDV